MRSLYLQISDIVPNIQAFLQCIYMFLKSLANHLYSCLAVNQLLQMFNSAIKLVLLKGNLSTLYTFIKTLVNCTQLKNGQYDFRNVRFVIENVINLYHKARKLNPKNITEIILTLFVDLYTYLDLRNLTCPYVVYFGSEITRVNTLLLCTYHQFNFCIILIYCRS